MSETRNWRGIVIRTVLLPLATGLTLLGLSPVANAMPTSHLLPGSTIAIRHHSTGESFLCTAGPIVSLPGGGRGVLTAGHCGDDGDVVQWDSGQGPRVTVGKLFHPVNKVIDGVMNDYAIVPVPSKYTSLNVGGKYPPATFLTVYELHSMYSSWKMCATGLTSGSRCGNMVGYTPDGYIETDFASSHGDSGGPVYLVNKELGSAAIVGIVHGHDKIDGHSYVMPIKRILDAYGVKLLVDSGN